jgi:hypothetical protein
MASLREARQDGCVRKGCHREQLPDVYGGDEQVVKQTIPSRSRRASASLRVGMTDAATWRTPPSAAWQDTHDTRAGGVADAGDGRVTIVGL